MTFELLLGVIGLALFVTTVAAGAGYGAFLAWKKRDKNRLPTYWMHTTNENESKNKF